MRRNFLSGNSRRIMFGILRKVASAESCSAVVSACGRAAAAVFSSEQGKVGTVSASKLKSFKKCDSSYTFSVYADKPKGGTYYVVYVPRMLSVWRSSERGQAELMRDQLNSLKLLIKALEKVNSKSFVEQLERLRDSVQKNHTFGDIHHASACNFPSVIMRLCESHSEMVNEASVEGYYPLHIAVENEAREAVQVLLSLGADLLKRDCRSRTAVHYAAEIGPEFLELLVEARNFGVAIDVTDNDGLTPLCLAIRSAKEKCVEILLDANCSLGPFPGGPLAVMITAAASTPELPRIIDLLLTRNPLFLTEQVHGSSTILHEKLDSRSLYHILDLGDKVDVNVRNAMGKTPLHCAVARDDLAQSIALLTYKADVNVSDCDDNTPLHVAAKNKNVKLVKLLLCFGASVRLRNGHGATALDVGRDSVEVMDCLRVFADSSSLAELPLDRVLLESMQERALEERNHMTLKERQKLTNVISFDGGGIKGLVLLQTLFHVEKLLGHSVMKHFHWLCGTSTGAILALGIAKGYSLRRCQRLYMRMKDELFIGQRPYSEQVIEHFLQEIFGEKTTMAELGPKKVIVTASLVQTNPPTLKLFRNYTLPLKKAENKALGFNDPSENIIWKCARYSTAAPMFFPPKDNFVDGALMSNNPTLDLMSDIHTYNAACIKAQQETVRVGCILSLGTGQAPTETLENVKWSFSLPRGLTEGMTMIQDMISLKDLLMDQVTACNGACVNRAQSWAHDQSIPFFRFSPYLSTQVDLDETDNEVLVELLWETEKYLCSDGKHDVKNLVKYLKSL